MFMSLFLSKTIQQRPYSICTMYIYLRRYPTVSNNLKKRLESTQHGDHCPEKTGWRNVRTIHNVHSSFHFFTSTKDYCLLSDGKVTCRSHAMTVERTILSNQWPEKQGGDSCLPTNVPVYCKFNTQVTFFENDMLLFSNLLSLISILSRLWLYFHVSSSYMS